MLTLPLLILSVLQGNLVSGIELNSLFPRFTCYSLEQPDCNENFIDVFKKFSRSATNLTSADTFFWMFTRSTQENPENLQKCAGRLPPSTKFNPRKRLIVIIMPFFFQFCDIAMFRELKDFILEREDCNVLVVDYSWGNSIDYGTAVLNARIVAHQTAIVLRRIQKQTGIKPGQMYLIAHSLGAQISGMVGHLMKGKIGRITGLDPARPGFAKESTPPGCRLDRTDARFVDIWHCNAGPCLPDAGIEYDAGDIDFYINGGNFQPSCYLYRLKSILRGDIFSVVALILPSMCSHNQCVEYFKMSINPGDCQFVAMKCEKNQHFKFGRCNKCGKHGKRCTVMGFDTEKYFNKSSKFPQRYYVDTSLECPYCDNSKIRFQGFSDTYKSCLQTTPEEK